MGNIKEEIFKQIDQWIDSGEYRYSNATHYLKTRMGTIAKKLQKEDNHREEFLQGLAENAAWMSMQLEKYMWISVDDKLPDKNKDVLVCGVYKAKPFIEVDYYCDDECFFYNDGLDGEKVTHWCYLPEFPETEE